MLFDAHHLGADLNEHKNPATERNAETYHKYM